MQWWDDLSSHMRPRARSQPDMDESNLGSDETSNTKEGGSRLVKLRLGLLQQAFENSDDATALVFGHSCCRGAQLGVGVLVLLLSLYALFGIRVSQKQNRKTQKTLPRRWY